MGLGRKFRKCTRDVSEILNVRIRNFGGRVVRNKLEQLLVTQCNHRIDPHSTAGREESSEGGNDENGAAYGDERKGIGWFYFEKKRFQQAAEGE
jgi:hypothetical protein